MLCGVKPTVGSNPTATASPNTPDHGPGCSAISAPPDVAPPLMEPTGYAARLFGMRPATLAVLVLLAGLWAGPWSTGPAAASCVGPSLEGEHLVLAESGENSVTGTFFFDNCNDTNTCEPGCGCTREKTRPSQDVVLRLHQGGHTWTLATADADDDWEVTWAFELPPDVEPGRAELEAEGASSVSVPVRVR